MIAKPQKTNWRLRDLVNLAVQIRRDGSKTDAELQSRDKRIGQEIYSRSKDPVPHRAQVILLWIRRLYQSRADDRDLTDIHEQQVAGEYRGDLAYSNPGGRVMHACKLIGFGLAIVGLGTGWSTGALLLAYTGAIPINVLNFVGTVVIGQLLILPFTVITLTKDLNLNSSPYVGPVLHLAKQLLYRMARVRSLTDPLNVEVQSALSFHRLYRRVELWLILLLLQIFAIAFNSGVLLSAFYLVATTDLAFSWATTLNLDALQISQFVDLLALPWSGLWPAAVPSVELIEATQYVRLGGSYLPTSESGALSRSITTGWWPFLIAATLFYGLFPRLIIGGWILVRLNRYLRNFTCNTVDGHNIYQRLIRELPAWRADSSQPLRKATALHNPPKLDDQTISESALPRTSLLKTSDTASTIEHRQAILPRSNSNTVALAVVLWRDLPVSLSQTKQFLKTLQINGGDQIIMAGGSNGDLEAVASAKQLAFQKTDRSFDCNLNCRCILILVESFEAPGKAIKRFATKLGEHTQQREIVIFIEPVTLAGDVIQQADQSRRALWHRHVRDWASPWIGMIEQGGDS